MNEPLKRIRLKCRFEGDIRTVAITPESEYAELKKRLSSDYGFDVSLKYEDKDGDFIILSSQHDLDDLFIFGENETVNVNVSETIFLPHLQLKGSAKSSGTVSSTMPPVKDWSRNGSANSVTSHGNMLRPIVTNNRVERFPSINDNSSPFRHESSNIRWKRAEMLGQGAFGVVYLGLNIDTGELMAVKQMATEEVSKRELSSLENEISLLRNLRHPNIVRYIGTELTQSSLSIFLEYVPGGSLKALIDKFGRLEEAVAKSYTRQLLIGLEYLHRNGIAHRDIKGANCLVGNDGVIKLADFGNSKHWRANPGGASSSDVLQHQTQQISSGDIKGTPSWMAPEIVRDQTGTISWKKADVWSLACTTLEMTTGRPPWSQFGNSVTILYHLACQDTLPEYPEPASVELVTFLNVCLQRDPTARPDITSLLLHPFVSANILPSGQNSSAAAGWGAPYSQQQQQSGSQLFANRPSTVSSAVFSQWDSPHHSNQQQQLASRAPSARAPIGGTVQTVISSAPPLGSPRGAQHRYSYSESNASVAISPRPTPLGFQENSFPLILTARERSFRGDLNAGADEQTVSISRRPSLLMAAQTTSSLLRDTDPELSHERPQSGRIGDSHPGRSVLSSDQQPTDGHFSSRSPLDDPDDEALPSADPLPRAGLMPPIQMAKPKIKDRTGKRTAGGKKTRKRQQAATSTVDLASDGEASISSLQSGAMSAARNRKAAASPLPVSPAKRTPSASQTSKDVQKTITGAAIADSPVPPLDMALSAAESAKTADYDSDESAADALRSTRNKTARANIEDEQRVNVDLGDSFTIQSLDIMSCVSTARLPLDTVRGDDHTRITPRMLTVGGDGEEPLQLRSSVEEQLVPLMSSVSLDESGLAKGLDVPDPSIDALDPQAASEQQFYDPCLSPYLSHSVDGLVDQEPLLDVSASLSMPVATPKATADVPHHAPLTRTASRNNAGFMAKSVDLSMTVRGGNSASRQQLHSRSVQVVDRDTPADLLDISCDSLEALQVQGLKPPRTAMDRDASRTSTSNAPNRRLKRVSTADPQHYSEVADESRLDSSVQARDETERRVVLGEAQLLDEHSSWVTRLRAPQRTALLVSASTDGTIRIWGPAETASRAVLDTATFAQSMAKQAESSIDKPDKKSSANASSEADASMSSARTVKVLNAWAEDSCDTVWAACSDGALRVWSGAEGRPLRLLKGHDEPVTAMEGMDASGAISGGVQQSACLVSTGSADRTVRIWDVRAKKAQVFLFRGHGDTVLTLRWGEGGRSLISGGKDKTIRIWDTRAGRLRSTLEKHFGAVGAIRMFPGGSGAASNISFFSAGRDSVLNAWTANGDCVFSQTAHRGAATFLSEINFGRQQINAGGPLMASLGADNIVKLWDLRRVRIVSEIQSPVSAGNVSRAVWCGQSLVVSSSSGLVRQYDHVASGLNASTDNGGGGEWSSRDLASHGQASTDLIATDSFLASSSRSGQILRWNYA